MARTSEASRAEMHKRVARCLMNRANVQRDTGKDDAMLLALIQRELHVLTLTEMREAFLVVAGALASAVSMTTKVVEQLPAFKPITLDELCAARWPLTWAASSKKEQEQHREGATAWLAAVDRVLAERIAAVKS